MKTKIDFPCKDCITLAVCTNRFRETGVRYNFTECNKIHITCASMMEVLSNIKCQATIEYVDCRPMNDSLGNMKVGNNVFEFYRFFEKRINGEGIE